MQKEKKLIPQLRFPEFQGMWKENKLDNLLDFKNGINASKDDYGFGYKFINVLDIIENDSITYDKIKGEVNVSKEVFEKNLVQYGDILFQRSSETRKEVGQSNVYLDKEKKATFGGFVIRGKKIGNYEPFFFHLLLKSSSARKEITTKSGGSTRYNVGQDILSSIKLLFPSLPEQQKIANFLTAIDHRIQTLEKKKSLLEHYKKGVMQKIFKQELRFKDEDGNDFEKWKKLQLIDVAERIKTKNKVDNQNVLTISAQLGLVSQLEYFNKSVSAKNLTGYYLLEKNDFAYNKSYSNGYPMGAIKRLDKYDLGVVSTLYICFRFNDKVSLDFMEQYFEAGLQNKEIEKVAQEGARNHGLLNIGVNDFFEIDLKLPSLKEQTKIANFLSAIDKEIDLVNTKIEHTKAYKKGLLQQMFV